jgi:hypothetical protein
MRAKSLTAYITRLGAGLQIPVHFHSLRHFAVTELVHAGVDLRARPPAGWGTVRR